MVTENTSTNKITHPTQPRVTDTAHIPATTSGSLLPGGRGSEAIARIREGSSRIHSEDNGTGAYRPGVLPLLQNCGS
jgi:hypothetical protein